MNQTRAGIASVGLAAILLTAGPGRSDAQPAVPVPTSQTGAAEKASAKADLEIRDAKGKVHIVSGAHETSRFFRSGTPFRDADLYAGAPLLDTLLAVNLHTPKDQARISKIAMENGNRAVDSDDFREVRLIPLSAIEDMAFARTKAGRAPHIESRVRLIGGPSFTAGEGYGRIAGKEDLGALGTAEFSSWLENVEDIRSLAPVAFVGDFRFFAAPESPPRVRLKNGVFLGNSSIEIVKPLDLSTALPFKVEITDTIGTDIVLDQALFCEADEELTGRRDSDGDYYDDSGSTLRFTSDLNVTQGGTSKVFIAASKLSRMNLGKVDNDGWGGFDANVTLRTGQNVDLVITPVRGNHAPTGIIGYSTKGWVWIPWQAIATVRFEN